MQLSHDRFIRLAACCVGLILSNLSLLAQESVELTLKQATEIALANSPEIATARIQYSLGVEQFKLDIRRYFPSLSVNIGQTSSVDYIGPDSYNKQLSISINQPLFDGGTSIVQRKISNLQLQFQIEGIAQNEIVLKTEVWGQFNSLLLNQKDLELSQAHFAASEKQLQVFGLEAKQGSITALDLLDAQVQVRQQSLELKKKSQGIKQAEFQMRRLLKLDASRPLLLNRAGEIAAYSGRDFKVLVPQLIAIALTNNGELKKGRFQLLQKTDEFRLSDLVFVPQIAADFSFGFSGNDFPLTQSNFNFGLNFSFPNLDSPIEFNAGIGLPSTTARSINSSGRINLLQKLTSGLERVGAKIGIDDIRQKIDEQELQLKFTFAFLIESYADARESLRIQRSIQEMEKLKIRILEKRLEIGEIRLPDLLKERMIFTQKETALVQAILSLIKQEQEMMSILGLSPEEFEAISIQEFNNAL